MVHVQSTLLGLAACSKYRRGSLHAVTWGWRRAPPRGQEGPMATLSAEVVAAANAQSRRLRELLHAPRILVMPGAYDVLSARLFESLGFPAIQGTSGGIAAIHGLYDEELLGRETTAAIYREMVAAVKVPLTADGEKGY